MNFRSSSAEDYALALSTQLTGQPISLSKCTKPGESPRSPGKEMKVASQVIKPIPAYIGLDSPLSNPSTCEATK